MRIILCQDVDKLGKSGDIVNVKSGFARNFLFPKRLALKATDSNIKLAEKFKEIKIKELEVKKKAAEELAQRLQGFSFTITQEASVDDKLYGSVTSQDIVNSCKLEGFDFDKKQILLDEPIKTLGIYKAEVVLHPEVKQEIKIWVVKK